MYLEEGDIADIRRQRGDLGRKRQAVEREP